MNNATELSEVLIDSYENEGYQNRQLSQKEIDKMLDSHGVAGYDVESTKDWTLFDMLAFLGY